MKKLLCVVVAAFAFLSLAAPCVAGAAEAAEPFRPKDAGMFVLEGQAAAGDSVRPDPSPAAQFGF